jgi:hypothetical protein
MSAGFSLHVGLNHVNASSYGGWPGTLQACENDARAMQAIAVSLGYASTILLTEEATARKVIAAITRSAKGMQPGDAFLLTYSGHGSQVPDTNGDEAQVDAGEVGEVADKKDETWVLYDRMLIDDELWALWSLFPAKSRIIVLSDSCYSGTVSKAVRDPWDASPARRASQFASKRMPLDVEERTYKGHRRTYDAIQKRVPARDAAAVLASVVLVSGCQDNQTSLDGKVNSLFTRRMLQVWSRGRFDGSITELHEKTRALMPRSQQPNLYTVGKTNRSMLSAPALRI